MEKAPLLSDTSSMNIIDSYILPHYESKEKYTKLSDEIINENKNLKFIRLRNDEAVIVNTRDDYKIVKTD